MKIVKYIHSQRCIGYDRDEHGRIVASIYREEREYMDSTREWVTITYHVERI